MIINSSAVQAASRVYAGSQPARGTQKVAGVGAVEREDALELSHEAQSFSDVLTKLKGMSDVREDKINALKNGATTPNSLDIAQKLLMMRF